MEITDYVDFKTALALKKAGFNEPCDSYYSGNGSIAVREDPECFNCYKDLPICSRPTLWHVQKWMREKKDLLVSVIPVCYYYEDREWVKEEPIKWCFTVNNLHSIAVDHQGRYATYEQAISAGIEQAIKLINLKD